MYVSNILCKSSGEYAWKKSPSMKKNMWFLAVGDTCSAFNEKLLFSKVFPVKQFNIRKCLALGAKLCGPQKI